MPNHVKNVLKFKDLPSKSDVEFIIGMIAREVLDPDYLDEVRDDYVIDFNKIIPEPATIEECPEDYRVEREKAHISEDDKKPWFNWYEWRNEYWGTKWNAYDCYTKFDESSVTFVFNTAWNMPYPVIKRLDVLGYDLELEYADEDLGHHCGRLLYTSEHGWTHYDESEMDDPEQFAENLWDRY